MCTAISISHLSITSVAGAAIATIRQTCLSIYLLLTIVGLKHSLIFRNVSRIILFRELLNIYPSTKFWPENIYISEEGSNFPGVTSTTFV